MLDADWLNLRERHTVYELRDFADHAVRSLPVVHLSQGQSVLNFSQGSAVIRVALSAEWNTYTLHLAGERDVGLIVGINVEAVGPAGPVGGRITGRGALGKLDDLLGHERIVQAAGGGLGEGREEARRQHQGAEKRTHSECR
jgi:hypothetical protein